MMRPSICFLLFVSLTTTATTAAARSSQSSTRGSSQNLFLATHAVIYSPAVQIARADSLDSPEETTPPVEKSPPGAAIRSAILPGWGQFYTENRLKGILFAGAQVGLFSLWWTEKRAGDRDLDVYHSTGDTSFYNSGISHRNRASSYFSWGLVVSLASVLDAYIDAHLYRFEEKVRMDDEGRVEVSVRLY